MHYVCFYNHIYKCNHTKLNSNGFFYVFIKIMNISTVLVVGTYGRGKSFKKWLNLFFEPDKIFFHNLLIITDIFFCQFVYLNKRKLVKQTALYIPVNLPGSSLGWPGLATGDTGKLAEFHLLLKHGLDPVIRDRTYVTPPPAGVSTHLGHHCTRWGSIRI